MQNGQVVKKLKEKEREKLRQTEREKKDRLKALKTDNIAEYRKHVRKFEIFLLPVSLKFSTLIKYADRF